VAQIETMLYIAEASGPPPSRWQ